MGPKKKQNQHYSHHDHEHHHHDEDDEADGTCYIACYIILFVIAFMFLVSVFLNGFPTSLPSFSNLPRLLPQKRGRRGKRSKGDSSGIINENLQIPFQKEKLKKQKGRKILNDVLGDMNNIQNLLHDVDMNLHDIQMDDLFEENERN